MMRMIALAAALLVGTAAVAQTMPEAPATPPAAPAQPDAMTPPAPAEAPPPADPATAAATPSTAPVAQAGYPRCSATVTDQCRQSSARESDWKGGPAKHRRKRG